MEGAGHLLPDDQTTTISKPETQRVYIKCDRCRHDRKKCEFTKGNAICKRCEALNHECTGPKKADKKVGTKRKADEAEDVMNQLVREDGTTKTIASEQPSVEDRPMPKRNANYGRGLHGMAVNVGAQRLYTQTRSVLKNSMSFEKPSDPHLITPTCQKSQELLNHIDRQLGQLQACLISGFDGLQPQRRCPESQKSIEEAAQMVDPESGEPVVVLCTANIHPPHEPASTQFRGRVHNTFKELPMEYYLHTEKAVSSLIASIPQDNSEEWAAHCRRYTSVSRKHGPFPAFVIAWLNLDTKTAYKLWLDTVKEGTVVDILGRSFMHIVTESGDPCLNEMPPEFLKYAEVDGRDLCLLDLAIIGNGSSIVIKLIEEGYDFPPFTRAMQRALLGNRPEIARAHLLEHLSWSEEFELDILAALAHEKGFTDLENAINKVVPYQPTVKDAQASLNVDLSFMNEMRTFPNFSSGLTHMNQPYQMTQNYPIPWENAGTQGNIQYQWSRNDPGGGGGGHSHLHDPRYPAS